jgi:2-dehydropantoate 2-reductase
MKKIKTVYIMGAGAMGAAYAAMFTDAIGFSVAFVARGKRYERLKNKTFMDKLVQAIAVGIDAVQVGDRVTYAQPGKIVFGPMGEDGGGPPLEPISEALDRAGIANEVPDDMLRVMWWKFMINVGINQASAVLRAPYGVFQSSADARALMHLLMQEVLDLADKAGVDL